MGKRGVSSILVVAILLIAVVAVAGAYIVLKDKDDGKAIMGELGAGSKFYYDVEYPAGSDDEAETISAPDETTILVEVIGEDATYYFLNLSYLDGYELTTLKMHKAKGDIEQAKNIDGKWALEIITDFTDKTTFTLEIEMYDEYGPMISSMEILSEEELTRASIDTSRNVLEEPTEYVPSEFFGNRCTYSYYVGAEIWVDSVKNWITIEGTEETRISGSSADSMVIESNEDLYFELYEDGVLIEELHIGGAYTFISDYTYEIPDTAKFGEEKIIEYDGKDVNVIEVTIRYLFRGVSFDLIAYVGVDNPIMYQASADKESPEANIVMSILLEKSDF